MKTTHTPGEWMQEIESTVKGNFAIFERNTDTHIATVHNIGAEAEANARLIAAAPDLLTALDDLLGYMEGYEHDYNNGEPLPVYERARQAIHKAIQGA
jgi:hypothetical protein